MSTSATTGPVLVTGVAGFIGSHTAEALLRRGQDVIGVDNFDPLYDPALKRRYLNEVIATAKQCDGSFEFVEADLCDSKTMTDLVARTKPNGMIHLAAKAGVRPSIEDPEGYVRANITATTVLFEVAKKANLDRFVMASSSSVYGNNDKVPFAETDDVSGPISPYAATKRSCELLAHAHHHLTGMPTACLRFFTVFGPRQRPDLAIMKFMHMIRDGKTIQVFGDGSSSRDYTFIDDIVAGVIASYDRIDTFGYRIWNLGGSDPVTLTQMVETIEDVMGHKATIDRQPMQPGDVDRTFADVTRPAAELDYKAHTNFRDGVAAQWAWVQDGQ